MFLFAILAHEINQEEHQHIYVYLYVVTFLVEAVSMVTEHLKIMVNSYFTLAKRVKGFFTLGKYIFFFFHKITISNCKEGVKKRTKPTFSSVFSCSLSYPCWP